MNALYLIYMYMEGNHINIIYVYKQDLVLNNL